MLSLEWIKVFSIHRKVNSEWRVHVEYPIKEQRKHSYSTREKIGLFGGI